MDTLFFVKTRISEDCEINTAITDENVFCRCGECGKDFPVDLTYWVKVITDDGISGYGVTAYCEECTKNRKYANVSEK